MTAKEIRAEGVTRHATPENQGIVDVLEEIAAQLAEANEIAREQLELNKKQVADNSDPKRVASLSLAVAKEVESQQGLVRAR